MLETILSLVGSSFGGGLLGVFGTFIKSKSEYKNKKLDYDHSIAMHKADMESMKLEAQLKVDEIQLQNEGRLALANVEMERAQDVNDANIRQASYTNDKASYGNLFIDGVRGLMRPMITTYLLILMTYISYQINTIVGGVAGLPVAKIWALYHELIIAIVFLTTTTITWWFGTRPVVKKEVIRL
tara:strand:- start:818 stop:1369 length:552 start_codon:yes stop_codon:yes gene_type:complete